jgi:hypothetical protein
MHKIIIGEEKTYILKDVRGVGYNPFSIDNETPMLNPVSWELIGKWEDGFHLSDSSLIRIQDNKIVEAFKLQHLEKEKDLL